MNKSKWMAGIFGIIVFCSAFDALPQDAKSLLNQGIDLRDQGKYAEAIAAFSKAIQQNPSDAEAYIQRGYCKRRLNPPDNAGALADYDKGIALSPLSPDPYVSRGLLFKGLGDQTRALKDYDKALGLDPSNKMAYYNRANLLNDKSDYRGALADLDKAIKLDSAYARAYGLRGRVKHELKDLRGAITDLDKAIELNVQDSPIFTFRAVLKEELGDLEGAQKDYERAYDLNPKDSIFKKNLELANRKLASAQTSAKPSGGVGSGPGQAKTGSAGTPKPGDIIAGPAQPKTGSSGTPKPGDILAGPWLPDNPDDPAIWNLPDTPWKKGDVLVSGPAMTANLDTVTKEALDYSKLSPDEFRFAVSAVMESMRLIYGEMSAAEEQKFQANWAPILDFPTLKASLYFNALSPLLSEFLDLRTAIVCLGLQFDEAWAQAGVAAGFEDEDAAAEALSEAKRLQEHLAVLKQRMIDVVARIKRLGDPPNPYAARHRARRALDQAFDGLLINPFAGWYGEWEEDVEDEAGQGADFRIIPEMRQFFLPASGMDPVTKETVSIMTVISLLDIPDPSDRKTAYWSLSYSEIGPDAWEAGLQGRGSLKLTLDGDVFTRVQTLAGAVPGRESISKRIFRRMTDRLNTRPSWLNNSSGLTPKGREDFLVVRAAFHEAMKAMPAGPVASVDEAWRAFQDVKTRFIKATKSLPRMAPQLETAIAARFERRLGKTPPSKPASPDSGGSRPGTGASTASPQPSVDAAEKARREEDIAEHATVIASLKSMVEKWKAERDKEKIPDRIRELNQSIFQAVANIQQEYDAVATIQTGELVRTRSVFDEASHQRLVEDCATDARKAQVWPRAEAQIDKMIDLLPPDEARSTREWANRQLDAKARGTWDTEKLKQVTQAVLHKIQGRQLAEEAAIEERINAYEEVKWGAGMGLMLVAPFATAQIVAGEGSWLATQVPSLIAMGFGAGTGFVEGGLTEAVVSGLRFYSITVDTAASFMEGFNATAEKKFEAGLQSAAMTFLFRKAPEFIAGRLIKAPTKSGPEPPKRTWKEVIEDAGFQQAKKDGQSLVKNFERANEAFEAMIVKQKPSSMSRNDFIKANADRLAQTPEAKALTQAMAKVESSYTAKMAINAKKIPDKLRQDYNQSLESFLEKPTVARTQELMKKAGWNDFEMKQIRHSANTKKVGFDKDLAVKEDGWTPMKNGVPMTIEEFRRDLDKCLRQAYREKSYRRSSDMADWKGTTSLDPEAYLDKNVLNITRLREQGINPLPGLNKNLALETAGVNVKKVELALGKGTMVGKAEACRTLAKEINTKILPFCPEGSLGAKYYENLMAALQRGGQNPRQGMLEVYGITGRRLNELAYVLRDRLAHIIQTGNR